MPFPDTPTRLAAVRAGGQGFLTGTLEASSLMEKIEVLTCVAQYEPYKVLIIDDSRAQALHTERLLNSAGIVTRTLIEPIQAMAELADFQPDLIILDMYMPTCTGTGQASHPIRPLSCLQSAVFLINSRRDRKSTRLNSSHYQQSRMPSSA